MQVILDLKEDYLIVHILQLSIGIFVIFYSKK